MAAEIHSFIGLLEPSEPVQVSWTPSSGSSEPHSFIPLLHPGEEIQLEAG